MYLTTILNDEYIVFADIVQIKIGIGWDFPFHPTNKQEEDLYVSSYIEKFIKIHSQFERDIWTFLYGGMYSICDYLSCSW